MERATAASQSGRREEARELLVDVLALEPDNLEAWIRLAELAATPEREALYYGRAAAVDPRSLRAQKGLEEAQARLQPVRARAKTAEPPAPQKEERASAPKAVPVSPAALPPDAPIFADSQTAPFELELGRTAATRRPSAISAQQSAVSGEQPAASGQQSVVSGQESATSGE